MIDYVRNVLILPFENCRKIPIDWPIEKIYRISFDGWIGEEDLNVAGKEMNVVLNLASESLKLFVEYYQDKFAFSEPMIPIKNDGTFTISVGVMSLEEFNKRKEFSVPKNDCNINI